MGEYKAAYMTLGAYEILPDGIYWRHNPMLKMSYTEQLEWNKHDPDFREFKPLPQRGAIYSE